MCYSADGPHRALADAGIPRTALIGSPASPSAVMHQLASGLHVELVDRSMSAMFDT